MQIRLAIAAALFCAWSALALYLGHQWGRADGADRAAKLLSKQVDAVLAEQAEDRKDRKKLQASIDRMPRAERGVRNAVAANPSKCARPAAVADSVQAAIDSSNASRKVSGDP